MEREAIRDSLGVGFTPNFKTSVELDRGLARTIPDARLAHAKEVL